jgi:hypothetical protein
MIRRRLLLASALSQVVDVGMIEGGLDATP